MKAKLARATWSFKGHGALSADVTRQNNQRQESTRRPLSSPTALVESRHYIVSGQVRSGQDMYVRLLAQSSDVAPATRRLAARTSISPHRRPSGLKSGWESRPTHFSKSVGRPAVNRPGAYGISRRARALAHARTGPRSQTPTRVPVAAGFGVTVPVPIPSPG
jgi:hypothetical protein